MCGIAGAISFKQQACSREVLQNMAAAIAHRGPDDETLYMDESLALAFRRLSIIDVADGQQPIWNEDKSILIVVNGEIYNHKELREQLKQKHLFRSHSDSEVVLHLYEEYGAKALELLNGMFAIVIWDKQKNRLMLARDRLGIKPLYYTINNDKLLFASELKSLLMHPDCSREINWKDLEILNLQQKPDVSTYVKDVHHLEAGSYAFYSEEHGFVKQKYWSIESSIELSSNKSSQQFSEEYHNLLVDSVQKRLMSEVPVGVFLSGGIDSSLITAMAAEKNTQLHCFTVVERTTYRAGDVQQARDVAKQYGIPFYPVYFDAQKIASDFKLADLEEMICLIESPRFDPEWLFKSELHRAAKHYVPELKVILLGQGADEFAGGYSNSLGSNNSNWEDYLKNSVTPSVEFYQDYNKEVPERLRNLVRPSSSAPCCDDYHKKMQLLVYQMQYFNLWHEDRTSSYHSIESRVPFLDHRIVELLASVPSELHQELFWDKAIVRNSLHKTIDNYPRDKKKIPFFVTDDISSINEFGWKICSNIYPEFKGKYLSKTESIERIGFSLNSSDELFESVVHRRHDMYHSAWRLIEMMSITIFSQYLKAPESYLENMNTSSKEPLPLVADSDWQDLEIKYQNPPQNSNASLCSKDDVVNIPKHCEILNPLTEADGSTCLILASNGQQVRRISIDDKFYWVVQVVDEMGHHINEPKTLDYWRQRSGASNEDYFTIINQLISGGLLEKVGDVA